MTKGNPQWSNQRNRQLQQGRHGKPMLHGLQYNEQPRKERYPCLRIFGKLGTVHNPGALLRNRAGGGPRKEWWEGRCMRWDKHEGIKSKKKRHQTTVLVESLCLWLWRRRRTDDGPVRAV